jgi:hypothetical protein
MRLILPSAARQLNYEIQQTAIDIEYFNLQHNAFIRYVFLIASPRLSSSAAKKLPLVSLYGNSFAAR